MYNMKLIVAVDKEWGIGLDNKLLFWIPDDMKHFKEETKGRIVIMGRKTLESLPNGKPLNDRLNIVLTRQDLASQTNLMVCHSLNQLFLYLKRSSDEAYIIGGEAIYQQLLNYADTALVTKVNTIVPKDKYFPNLDTLSNWELVEQSENHQHKGLVYQYTKYRNNRTRRI